jgi:U3 small nucleolar RNA-associated protein 5
MMTQLANGMDATVSEDSDMEMDDAVHHVESESLHEDINAKPSFGDLIAAKSANPISIPDAFPPPEAGPLIPTESCKPVTVPSGISLSTVLTQALRTNDNNLLESCFHNTDTQIIRSTIQRMDSSLTGILIQKLAERLSSRPGRYGHLLVWVQWICVAHGGAIASQPDVVSKIKVLYKVLNQRSKALDSLLLLKGKLDMLDAQLGLRRQLLAERGPARNPDEGHVVYIEGEEEDSDGSDEGAADENTNTTSPATRKSKEKKNLDELVAKSDAESDGDEDMPMTNGVIAESEASDFGSDVDGGGIIQQDEGGLVDDEAEESDEDSHPSDREDDISEEEDISDDNEEDSEMDDFIDDGPVPETDSASETSVDKILEEPPPAKKHRQR